MFDVKFRCKIQNKNVNVSLIEGHWPSPFSGTLLFERERRIHFNEVKMKRVAK